MMYVGGAIRRCYYADGEASNYSVCVCVRVSSQY